jgi:cytochrome c biogenesis factor
MWGSEEGSNSYVGQWGSEEGSNLIFLELVKMFIFITKFFNE